MGTVARPDRESQTLFQLACPERILLHGVRSWVAAYKRGECGLHHLTLIYRRFDVPAAAPNLHAMLLQTAFAAKRSIDVRCGGCPGISPDEQLLLAVVALLQCDRRLEAFDLLCDWLPASVVCLSLEAAERLAQAFLTARLQLANSKLPYLGLTLENGAAGEPLASVQMH